MEERATTPLRPCGWLGTFSALVVWKAVIKRNYKQLLDEVFVISGIIKVEVSVITDNTNQDLDYSGYHKNRI